MTLRNFESALPNFDDKQQEALIAWARKVPFQARAHMRILYLSASHKTCIILDTEKHFSGPCVEYAELVRDDPTARTIVAVASQFDEATRIKSRLPK